MILKLIEKWACKHQWKVHHNMEVYNTLNNPKMPRKVRQTLICKKCGKIKQVDL